MRNFRIVYFTIIIIIINTYYCKAQYMSYEGQYFSMGGIDTTNIVFKGRNILLLGEKWFMGYSPAEGLDIGCYNRLGVPQSKKILITPLCVGIFHNEPSYKLDVNGDIASTSNYTQSSDIRLKSNICELGNCLEKLLLIEGKFYNKNNSELPELGIIAQELLDIYPNLVYKDNKGYYSINYSGLLPIIIEAMKEQNLILKKQEEEIKNLLK